MDDQPGAARSERDVRSGEIGTGGIADGGSQCDGVDTSDQRSTVMTATALISLALTLLQSILSAARVGGIAPDVVANIEAAVTSLLAVQGTPVTFSQLEGLRVTTKW